MTRSFRFPTVATAALLALSSTNAFVVQTPRTAAPTTTTLHADYWTGVSGTPGGGAESYNAAGDSIEEIVFKIYDDGRIEETVRGVRGNDCHKITARVNEELGKEAHTQPTEEMFQEKVQIAQKINLKNGNAETDWEGSTSW